MTDYFKIRFITESGFVSGGIRFVTESRWSHVDIILPDGTYLGARSEGGVQIRPANYCVPTRERRYAIPVEAEALEKMLTFAHAQIGKGYDFSDIAGILLREDWNSSDKWDCSMLATATAEAGGLYMLNVEPSWTYKVTPEMLHLSPYLKDRCYYRFEK